MSARRVKNAEVYFSPGIYFTHGSVASLVAQRSKRLPVMQETWV